MIANKTNIKILNELNLDIDQNMQNKFLEYMNLVTHYNNFMNLIGKSTIADFWNRHILDSIQILQFIKNKNIHIIDLGSGAGLPGILLSIAGIKEITLIESSKKKCTFLKKIQYLSPNKLNILNIRVDANTKLSCDILTSRAVTNISNFLSITHNIKCDKYLLFKGENYLNEIHYAKKDWSFQYKLYNSVTNNGSKIIEIDTDKIKYASKNK